MQQQAPSSRCLVSPQDCTYQCASELRNSGTEKPSGLLQPYLHQPYLHELVPELADPL